MEPETVDGGNRKVLVTSSKIKNPAEAKEGKDTLIKGYQQQYEKAIQQGSDEGLLVPKSVGSSDVS